MATTILDLPLHVLASILKSEKKQYRIVCTLFRAAYDLNIMRLYVTLYAKPFEQLQVYSRHFKKVMTIDQAFSAYPSDAMSQYLCKFVNLQKLTFFHNQMTLKDCEDLAPILKQLSSLTKFNIYKNDRIADNGIIALSDGIKELKNLEVLTLSNVNMTHIGASSLRNALVHCTKLDNLDISYNPLYEDGVKALSDCFRNLTRLCMNKVYLKSLASIADDLKNVKILQVAENGLRGGFCEKMESLAELHICEYFYNSSQCMEMIESLRKLVNLKKLSGFRNDKRDIFVNALPRIIFE